MPNNLPRISYYYRAVGHIAHDNGARANNCTSPHNYSWPDERVCSDPCLVMDNYIAGNQGKVYKTEIVRCRAEVDSLANDRARSKTNFRHRVGTRSRPQTTPISEHDVPRRPDGRARVNVDASTDRCAEKR